jgi:hypothetical protein
MDKLAKTSRKRFQTLALVEFDPQRLLPTGIDLPNLNNLIQAADVADDICWEQLLPDTDRSSLLEQAGDDEELKELILFNYGPYDCLNNEAPMLPFKPKFSGAGFYPQDLTREEFINYLKVHPEGETSFESPYTVIRRSNSRLTAIPYHIAYQDKVKLLSRILTEASATERHPLFRKFLAQRAQDILTDEYVESESTWVLLKDNPLDIVIGPYEVYEDLLMGLKSTYEARVLWRDFAETEKIQHFQQELPLLCQALKPQLGKSLVIEDTHLDLSVSNIIYAAGYANKAIPAVAFTLPNDERVIEEVGSRQIILKNVLEAKFHKVVWPLVEHVLQMPLEDEEFSCRNFFNHTLFHEISHSIGPHSIKVNGELTTVNRSLQQHYSVLEEAKADTLGACFMLSTLSDSDHYAFLALYVAGFMRSIRYGLSQAHGGANIIQFNYLLREGGFEVDRKSGKLFINEARTRDAVAKLASEIIDIQERGDFEAAGHFVSTYCVENLVIEELIGKVNDLPIDIRIRFKASA